TAEHVLRAPIGQVSLKVSFPALAARDSAEVWLDVTVLVANARLDIAVLELREAPRWLPRPVALRAARRPPPFVQLLGFPSDETRKQEGVWRRFQSGRRSATLLQLHWTDQGG